MKTGIRIKKEVIFQRKKFGNLKNFSIEHYRLALCDITKTQHTAKSFQEGKKFGEEEGGCGLNVPLRPAFSWLDLCVPGDVVLGEFSIRQSRQGGQSSSVGDGTVPPPSAL